MIEENHKASKGSSGTVLELRARVYMGENKNELQIGNICAANV